MKRLILEDNTPTNTDKYKIQQIKGEVDPDTKKQPTYEIGLSDNLLVYRKMGDDGKFSDEWLKFDNQEVIKKLKGKYYNLLDKDGNVVSIFNDTPEKRAYSSETKPKTKSKKNDTENNDDKQLDVETKTKSKKSSKSEPKEDVETPETKQTKSSKKKK